MLVKLLLAAFMFAHGVIHVSYLTPRPPATADGPTWPFTFDRSWILTPLGLGADVARLLGMALAVTTLAAFTLAAASVVGLAPMGLWSLAVALGAGSSIALLILFFHPWLVLGVVIDMALLVAVLVARWSPEGLGS